MNKEIKYWKEKVCNNKEIIISNKLKSIPAIYTNILSNLAKINVIKFIKITPDFLSASNEIKGGSRDPIAKPHHSTAIGISIIFDFYYKSIQFYEINSPIKGYGQKMVSAVLKELPEVWEVVIAMDWSNGFWDKMKEKYKNIKWDFL